MLLTVAQSEVPMHNAAAKPSNQGVCIVKQHWAALTTALGTMTALGTALGTALCSTYGSRGADTEQERDRDGARGCVGLVAERANGEEDGEITTQVARIRQATSA